MSLSQHAARGLKWQAIELLLRQLISLGIFATLSRLLDRESFGLFALVNLYLGFVAILAAQGLRAAIVQRRDLEPEHLDSAFWFSAGVATLIFGLTFWLAPIVAHTLGDPRLVPYLRVAAIIPLLNAVSNLHNTLFVRALDFRRPALRVILANLAGGVAGIVLALDGAGPWALVGQQVTVSAASGLFLWSASTYRPRLRFSWRHLKDLRSVSSAMFTTSLLWFVASRIDHYLIGRFAGASALGVYTLAGRLPELAKLVTHQPISQVSTPALARLQDDPAEMRRSVYAAMELAAFIAFPVFVGLAVVAREAVPLVFGRQWADAAPVAAFLSLYTLINTLMVFVHPTLLARGANRDYVILSFSQALLALVACAIGVRQGANGVAIAMVATAMVSCLPSLWLLRKWAGISPLSYLAPCARPALATAVMATALIFGLQPLAGAWPLAVVFVAKCGAGALIYAIFALTWQRSTLDRTLRFLRKAK